MLLYNDFSKIKARAFLDTFSEKSGKTDSRAFAADDTLTFTVRVPRVFCASSAFLAFYTDADMSDRDIAAKIVDPADDEFFPAYDSFSLTLYAKEVGTGLYYHTFGIDCIYGRLWMNTDGSFTSDRAAASRTQLTIYSEDFHTPDRFKGGIMYQIFPDRFERSGRVTKLPPRRSLETDWNNGVPQYAKVPGGEVANDKFFGGDLWGIADRLDYIKSLGVDILYLCPIFESASNHRYDTGDYMEIDPLLGGDEAFGHLVSELKKRGMKLILDGVFNHTGADSRYFNKFGNYPGAGAYNSKRSKFYKWYTFEDYPDEYRCWWGVKILPAVKSAEPTYRDFICGKKGVIRHYLEKGIDGWRLDVADELSDEFLDELRCAAKGQNPDSLILGEVWEDASNKVAYDRRRRYFTGRQLDSVMNYPLGEGVIDFVLTGDKTKLENSAKIVYRHYPKEVSDVLMNLLGTHDTERVLSVLAGVGIDKKTNDELVSFRLSRDERKRAVDRLKLAWAILCGFPGIPCVYYGDEAGMEGGRDPFNRMPFVKENADNDLTHFYRRVGAVRSSEKAFASGKIGFFGTADSGQLLFSRSNGEETILVAANLTQRVWELEVPLGTERLIGRDEAGDLSGIVVLEPYSVEYLKYSEEKTI